MHHLGGTYTGNDIGGGSSKTSKYNNIKYCGKMYDSIKWRE